jgi:hypothetical protein
MGKFFRNSHVVEPERRNLAESEKTLWSHVLILRCSELKSHGTHVGRYTVVCKT